MAIILYQPDTLMEDKNFTDKETKQLFD